MSTLEEIAVLLGFAAFAGVAVLAFLIFQQARHLRRLRDWAGRAPERAVAAAERDTAGDEEADAAEDQPEPEPEPERPGRIAVAIESLKLRYTDLDRRSPVDLRFLVAGLVAIALGVGIATSGFGLVGSGDGERAGAAGGQAAERQAQRERRAERRSRPRVAVLNGSAGPDGVGVQGAADESSGHVRRAGYRVGAVDNTEPLATTTIMYMSGLEEDAAELAEQLSGRLGSLQVSEMTEAVQQVANGAGLALVIGQDFSVAGG